MPSISSFEQLVHADLVRGLRDIGILAPNSIQSRAIPLGLSGRDVLVCAQTGSGKTLTFLLPILNRLLESSQRQAEQKGKGAGRKGLKGGRSKGKLGKEDFLEGRQQSNVLAVILAPTEQLAQQVAQVAEHLLSSCKQMHRSRIQLKYVNHLQSARENADRVNNGMCLIVGTPDIVIKQFETCDAQILAIDEADLLLCEGSSIAGSANGADFQNRQRITNSLLEGMHSAQLFLTMAHLTEQREKELLSRFPHIQQVGHTGVLVPTLRQCFHYFRGDESSKKSKLLWILSEAEKEDPDTDGATIIFCATSAKAIELQAHLLERWKTSSLHEESTKMLSLSEVADIIQSFRDGATQILVATDMSVRGLDFPFLRHVILYDVPADATAFVHCAGRTARSGNTGLVTCIVEEGNALETNFDGKAIHSLKDAPQLSFKTNQIL
ncbi:unnamed protein product [Durusdinium trenchii]|uniref:RNA helicase n=1 Tax=Durusdinium trenchii TaxID=1381693 RepID=A0ABP0JM68_9DINO